MAKSTRTGAAQSNKATSPVNANANSTVESNEDINSLLGLDTQVPPPVQTVQNVLPQQPQAPEQPQVKEEPKAAPTVSTVAKMHEKEFIPERILLKPIPINGFRLGLETTKEQFYKLPGTKYSWCPSIRGNTYQTGLHRISPEEVKELEIQLGSPLNKEFYDELTFRMDGSNPNGVILDLSVPYEKVVYLAMLDSHLIANNFSKTRDGSTPQAEWYIVDKEAEAETDAKERDIMLEAFDLYKKSSDARKKSYCKVLGINVQGLSDKVAATLLFKQITEKNTGNPNAKKQLEKFLEMGKWSDEKIAIYEEVEDAIAFNILRRNSAQDWVYGDEVIGSNKEQVISKLLDGVNQGLRIAIKSKLQLRK